MPKITLGMKIGLKSACCIYENRTKEMAKENLIEETIYEKFFDYEDKKLFEQFHAAKELEEQLFICKNLMILEQKSWI